MVGKQRVDEISAWNLDGQGGIVLLNPVRRVLFRLAGQEDGSWTATTDNGDLALVPSYKGVTAIPTTAGPVGTWQLARPGGKPLCTITLANEPQASGEGNLALTVADGCDKAIAALKLDGWMIEGVTLVLHGQGPQPRLHRRRQARLRQGAAREWQAAGHDAGEVSRLTTVTSRRYRPIHPRYGCG